MVPPAPPCLSIREAPAARLFVGLGNEAQQLSHERPLLAPLRLRLSGVAPCPIGAVPVTLWPTSLATVQPADKRAPYRWPAARQLREVGNWPDI